MTEPLPNEPVQMPPSAVGAVLTLVDWFRRELAIAWEKIGVLSVGRTAADRRAREEEQRADRAERRLLALESQYALAMTWGAALGVKLLCRAADAKMWESVIATAGGALHAPPTAPDPIEAEIAEAHAAGRDCGWSGCGICPQTHNPRSFVP